jgi:hypothetical protein
MAGPSAGQSDSSLIHSEKARSNPGVAVSGDNRVECATGSHLYSTADRYPPFLPLGAQSCPVPRPPK